MPRKQASAQLSMGMVQIPFGIAKASTSDVPDTTSLCACGATVSYLENDDGHRIQCNDSECGETFSWWNSVPNRGFELGDEMIELSDDEIDQARATTPVETGQVEKAVPVKSMLLHYAVTGNYYLLPEDEFETQYGVLVGVLNDEDLALLTYLRPFSKTKRYAIVSEAGVLMALELADKKALPSLEYDTDASMETQTATMLEQMIDDDPSLDDVEGHGLKSLVRQKVEADADDATDPDEIATEV